jgi:WhiB family redox-sensing transcriptional regulator
VIESAMEFSPSPSGALPHAVCVGLDTDLFFPDPSDARGIELAKVVCAECPVIAACLAGAIERGEKFGVFGGLTAEERDNFVRRSKRKRAIPECGTVGGYNRHRRLREPRCAPCLAAVAEKARKRHARLRAEAESQVAA